MNIDKAKIREGQWVWFLANGGKRYEGYVVTVSRTGNATVHIPSQKKALVLPIINLHDNESVKFDQQDIHSMKCLALDMGDKEWFDELCLFQDMMN